MYDRWGLSVPLVVLFACTPASYPVEPGDGGSDPLEDTDPPTDTDTDTDSPADPVGNATCATPLDDALETIGVPGLSAAIVKDGHLVCTTVAGHANLEDDQLVTEDTLFAWASVSKTLTATALMILYDEGRFDLDEDIGPYLPFEARIPSCRDQPITFRQLLTHTSSIVDQHQTYKNSYTVGDSPLALGDFLRGYLVPGGDFFDATGNFAEQCPGSVYHYSNIGAGLIGYLVEEISGTPFDQFCQERIFAPLGMDETAWHLADLDPSHVAMPYSGDSTDTFEPIGNIGFPTYPDGLLRTLVPQLARFLDMFEGLGEVDGVRILQQGTAEEMRRVQYPAVDDTQGLIWYYSGFGGGRCLLGHDGDDPGTTSMMYFDPTDGTGVILVANGFWYNDLGGAREAGALFNVLFDEASTW